MTPLLELRDIDKHFDGVHALRRLNLQFVAGEVHVLMGENGAGKSTAAKIIAGVVQPDGGEILFRGEKIRLRTPSEARQQGIGIVFQELDLFPHLTVAENIVIGNPAAAEFASVLEQKAVVIGCFITLALIFIVLLNRTVFGRYMRAVGDNEKAAIYAGIPLVRIKIWVYLLCGFLAGVAGLLHAAQCHQGNPNDGVAYELEAIAAVVIGGTSLAGGRGTITGTIIGTMIMGVLTNLLRLKMVDSNVELMIKAAIIVLAVWAQSRKTTA